MKKIIIKLDNNESEILMGNGLINKIGEVIKEKLPKTRKILIVTDSNVSKLYLESLRTNIKNAGFEKVNSISFEAGEKSKNIDVYLEIIKAASMLKLTREDAFVSLGGGVVGDITGFCAATYLRGINFVQVPTSFLAAIDASIGGKTGIDTEFGKNLIGAFWQPKVVIFDTDTLKTLPDLEYKNGLGEAIKYALLEGGEIYNILNSGLNESNIEDFIYLCAQSKARIVEKDEKEGGLRALLNLGHTIGHAEESITNFGIPHGMAVADGIMLMSKAALNSNEIDIDTFKKIENIINKYDVGSGIKFSIDDLMLFIENDKKVRNDGINVIKIKGIGNCVIEKMTFDSFKEYIK